MHRLIIDTDPGIDDAMAIALALCHPEIELLALTTVFGNASVTTTTRNARYVLDTFGATEVAVAGGAEAPRVQPAHPYPDFVHGADGLGNVYPTGEVSLDARRGPGLDTGTRHRVEERFGKGYRIVSYLHHGADGGAGRDRGEVGFVFVEGGSGARYRLVALYEDGFSAY